MTNFDTGAGHTQRKADAYKFDHNKSVYRHKETPIYRVHDSKPGIFGESLSPPKVQINKKSKKFNIIYKPFNNSHSFQHQRKHHGRGRKKKLNKNEKGTSKEELLLLEIEKKLKQPLSKTDEKKTRLEKQRHKNRGNRLRKGKHQIDKEILNEAQKILNRRLERKKKLRDGNKNLNGLRMRPKKPLGPTHKHTTVTAPQPHTEGKLGTDTTKTVKETVKNFDKVIEEIQPPPNADHNSDEHGFWVPKASQVMRNESSKSSEDNFYNSTNK